LKRKTIIMDESNMKRAIARITYEILERNKGTEDLCVVGILSRGVAVAERIAAKISELENEKIPCGALDITAYRDDRKATDTVDRTSIDFDVKNKNVVIVDDVFYTGRSTRAAIDALIGRGRPKSIQLAVLVDRGHRELPVRPDYVGKNLPTSREESVKVSVKEIDGSDFVAIYS